MGDFDGDTYGNKALIEIDGKPIFVELAILCIFRLYEWDGHGTHERLVYSRDKRSLNVAPRPSAFSAVRSPPWARARSRAIASPRPVPPLA